MLSSLVLKQSTSLPFFLLGFALFTITEAAFLCRLCEKLLDEKETMTMVLVEEMALETVKLETTAATALLETVP